jgi:hypothetical protein
VELEGQINWEKLDLPTKISLIAIAKYCQFGENGEVEADLF